VHRLPRKVLRKKGPSPHLHKVPIRSNKASPRNFKRLSYKKQAPTGLGQRYKILPEPKHQWGMKVILHTFLILALDGDKRNLRSDCLSTSEGFFFSSCVCVCVCVGVSGP
jgi:hypothetical protein